MAPSSLIHLVRHAEGYHQLPRDHPHVQIRDALLTERGVQQAKDFCDTFPYHHDTDLLCASPLRRALQTAQLAFAPELQRGKTILAIPEAMEAGPEPSDTGSPIFDLQAAFTANEVDFHLLDENWFHKEGINAPDDHSLRQRARKLRLFLKERPEQNVVLVTHGLFAHYVTEHVDPEGHQTGEYWQNVMWRSFKFTDANSEDAHLVETEESVKRHPRRSVS